MSSILETKKENLDINTIMLNPENPRLSAYIDFGGDQLSQDILQKNLEMLAHGESDKTDFSAPKVSFRALKASIYQLGRISTSIIVQKLEKPIDNFIYKVLEGNNRLTIYKQLHDSEKDKENYDGRWLNIPSEVIEETDEKIYHQIQLTAHMVQPKPWLPFPRAKYLHYIKNNPTSPIDYDEIAEICGGRSRKKQIEDEINAYELLVKWKDSDNYTNSSPAKFQHLYQYEADKIKLKAVGIDEETFLDLMDDDKIDYARDVRQLKDLWVNAKYDPEGNLKKILLDSGSEEAIKELDALKKAQDDFNSNDIIHLCKRLKSEISKLSENDARVNFANELDSLEILEDVESTLTNFIEDIKNIKKNS